MAAAAGQDQLHTVWNMYVPMGPAYRAGINPANPNDLVKELWKHAAHADLRAWAGQFCQVAFSISVKLAEDDGREVYYLVGHCFMPRPYTLGELEALAHTAEFLQFPLLQGITFEVVS